MSKVRMPDGNELELNYDAKPGDHFKVDVPSKFVPWSMDSFPLSPPVQAITYIVLSDFGDNLYAQVAS